MVCMYRYDTLESSWIHTVASMLALDQLYPTSSSQSLWQTGTPVL